MTEQPPAEDPTVAAIRAFKLALQAFDLAYDLTEGKDDPALDQAANTASNAVSRIRDSILNDPPQTLQGLAALLTYVSEEIDIAEWQFEAGDVAELMNFFKTLARSACTLASMPEPPPPGGLVIPLEPKI
jgi:hypothetical protein